MNVIDSSLLLDYLELGVLVIDEQGHILVWNRWLERYSGVKIGNAVGKKFPKFSRNHR